MCSRLFSVLMHIVVAFILVLNVDSAVGHNEESQNAQELLRTFWNVRNNHPVARSPDKQPSHVSWISSSSDVTPPPISSRTTNPHTDSVFVTHFTSLPPSLQTFFHDNPPFSSHSLAPSNKLMLDSRRNHSRITEKILKEENDGRDLADKEHRYHRVPVQSFENFLSSSTHDRLTQNSVQGNERNDNFTLSSGFQFRDNLHPGQNSWRKINAPGLSYVSKSDKLITRTMSASAETDKVNRFKGNLDFISDNDQQNRVSPERLTSSSSQARSLRADRPPERAKRELFLKNERIFPRQEVSGDRSDGQGTMEYGFDSLTENMGINGVQANDNENWKNVLQTRQSEPPQQLYLMKQISDSITAHRSVYPGIAFPTKGYFYPSDSERQSGAFQSQKRYLDSSSRDSVSGLNQNFHYSIPFVSLAREREPQVDHTHSTKRQFDAISNGYLSGMSQNHLGKRRLDYLGFARLPEKFKIFTEKRNFDAIGGGILSGIKQNHMGKRYYDVTSVDKDLRDAKQNHPNYEDFGSYDRSLEQPDVSENVLEKKDFGFISSDLLDNEYNIQDRLMDEAPGSTGKLKERIRINRNMDSLSDEIINSIHENDVQKYHLHPTTNYDDIDPTFLRKRLDAISDGALGGIRQNFFDKKYFNVLSAESLPTLHNNFLPKRYYNTFGTGFYKGNWQHFLSKRNFASPSIIWILDKNLQNKRHAPSSSVDSFNQLIYNFHDKEKLDSSYSNSIDGFNQNLIEEQIFPDKRSFDSISTNPLGGLGQNFLGSRKYSTGNGNDNGKNQLYQSLFNKRWVPFGENFFLKSPTDMNGVLLGDLASEDNSDFPGEESTVLEVVDYNRNVDLQDGAPQSRERAPFGSIPRFDYVVRLNKSQLSDSRAKRRRFGSIFLKADHNTHNALTAKSRDKGEMDKLYTNNLPDKRSFDPIDSFSSLSGIDQNFLESTPTKHRRIKHLPWMVFSKRNVADESLEMTVQEKDYHKFTSDPSSLFQDSDISVSQSKVPHENVGDYIVKFNPPWSHGNRLESSVKEDHDRNHGIILHVVDRNDNSDDNYEGSVETLRQEIEEIKKENNEKLQHPTADIWSSQSTSFESADND